jgi:hypothetical protein
MPGLVTMDWVDIVIWEKGALIQNPNRREDLMPMHICTTGPMDTGQLGMLDTMDMLVTDMVDMVGEDMDGERNKV